MNSFEEPLSDAQKFRIEKHATFDTPRDILGSFIEHETASPVLEDQRLIAGETNEVHDLKLADGRELVARIFHGDKESRFEKEKWAIEQCATLGVPVPEVLTVGRLEVGGKTLPISILTKLPGRPLDKVLENESAEARKLLFRDLGELLKKIHSVPTGGFGKLDAAGNGKFANVEELFTGDRYVRPETILSQADGLRLDRELIEGTYQTLKKYAKDYPKVDPRLVHGDLSTSHVLVDKMKICGIIDFESANGADPVSEFARWELKFANKFPVEEMKEGYGKDFFGGDYELRKNIWRLYQGLVGMSYCAREKKQYAIDKHSMRLQETLRLLS